MVKVIFIQRIMCFCVLFALCVTLSSVEGHGRLIEPPSRASMWRYGYDTPVNYADNQMFCGGYTVGVDTVLVTSHA